MLAEREFASLWIVLGDLLRRGNELVGITFIKAEVQIGVVIPEFCHQITSSGCVVIVIAPEKSVDLSPILIAITF